MNAQSITALVSATETKIVTRDLAWGQKQSAELVSTVTGEYVESVIQNVETAAEVDSGIIARLVSTLVYNYSNTNAVANRLRKAGLIPAPDAATKARGGIDLGFLG